MNVVLYPFFSQQDKANGTFLLRSDSAVRSMAWIGSTMVGEGWGATLVLPTVRQCSDSIETAAHVKRVPYNLPLDNLQRRLDWRVEWLKEVCRDADVLITTHEFLAYPVKCLCPNVTVIMEVGIPPSMFMAETEDMFPLAWRKADLCAGISRQLAALAGSSTVWTWAYDGRDAEPRNWAREIPVLFGARCSATGYSKHQLFIDARVPGAVIADPTSYLREQRVNVDGLAALPFTRSGYVSTLHRAKVYVSLIDNMHGGYGLREAVACGCVPVTLRRPEYEDLLTVDWPYFVEREEPDHVREVCARAVADGVFGVPTAVREHVMREIAACSYTATWRRAKEDIVDAHQRRRARQGG